MIMQQISVLCPTYNEYSYIDKLLRFFIEVNPSEKELLVIDGGSTDGTKETVKSWSQKSSNIRLIENPNKTVPYALNIGIKESKGDIIVRIDAHSKYSSDYFMKILETFEKTDADIVGGPTRVAYDTDFQKAVAVAISNPLGIGNSKVHNINYNGYSDHVTFGAWKREIFDDVGYFDEQLKRNQDDEFHYRAKSKGKKIYLSSDIKLWYFPRKNLPGLFKQYFQYGYYKPLVLKKVKSEIKTRHLIPSLFVASIFTLFFIKILFGFIFIGIYLLAISFFAFTSKLNLKTKLLSYTVYPAIHIGYGLGFILGIHKIFQKNK